MPRPVLSLLVVMLFLVVGCYETTFFLGKVEDAKVDASLLGRWDFDSPSGNADDATRLDVAKFDDHRYRIDWTSLKDGKVMKMAGHITEVKGKLFVHAASLDNDGKPGPEHYLIRIDRDGDDSLTISNLDSEYMKSKNIDSDASLRATIEASLDDPNLYVADVMIGKRAK